MLIIGREDEKSILQELLDSNQSEFLAIYGRRRIGKTFLIENYYREHIVFHHIALTGEDQEEIKFQAQLENFWQSLYDHGYSAPTVPRTWLSAFQHLITFIKSIKGRKKKVIFFDEIPWMDSPRSNFLSAFGLFWNKFCSSRSDIILVICGSSASWILNKVIMNRGSLHNRITRTINLLPMTLGETKQYLKHRGVVLRDIDIALLYMTIGGVAYYLNGVKKGKSIKAILNDLFTVKNAYLKDEYQKVFKSLFRNYKLHMKIIAALGSKSTGLSRYDIIKHTKIDGGGALTEILNDLQACGFILKMNSFEKKNRDGVYRLIDEFSQFHLRFNSRGHYVITDIASTQKFKVWSGYAFENLCIRHIDAIAKHIGISGMVYGVSSLYIAGDADQKGAQIDLIIDRADQCVNIIEIKFHQSQNFVMTDVQMKNIFHKLDRFKEVTKTQKNVFVNLITSVPAIKNEYYLSCISDEVSLHKIINA